MLFYLISFSLVKNGKKKKKEIGLFQKKKSCARFHAIRTSSSLIFRIKTCNRSFEKSVPAPFLPSLEFSLDYTNNGRKKLAIFSFKSAPTAPNNFLFLFLFQKKYNGNTVENNLTFPSLSKLYQHQRIDFSFSLIPKIKIYLSFHPYFLSNLHQQEKQFSFLDTESHVKTLLSYFFLLERKIQQEIYQ